jgi:hypothetical protein
MRFRGQLHAPSALPPGKRPGSHCIGCWVAPRARSDGCGKSRPHRDFFSCAICSFDPFCNPSLLLHVTYIPYYCPYTTSTTQTSMGPAGFEPTIPASERPQTQALDRAATGIGVIRSPDRPALGKQLYRLRYPGPQCS